ncbi:MAG TPA: acetyl-CoA carboxylase biotin carboxyl carrier protein [Pyrinomonadaceae bacterium]|nr:acetyl-CoA carboxylase biotin carboxyl carrier protein [Pyrinomonadaceae bacterium]
MSEYSASAKAKEMEKQGGTKQEAKGKQTGSGADPSFNMDELRELAELVNEHGFTDFEFENENIRVRLSKTPPASAVQYLPQAPMAAPGAAPALPIPQSAPEATQPEPSAEDDLYKIVSPIVGTFYRSPGPDKDAYVKEGSKVTPPTIVCIVEAMKLMNEIEAEVEGEVVKIYVENGQPVEYGQPLFGIRK